MALTSFFLFFLSLNPLVILHTSFTSLYFVTFLIWRVLVYLMFSVRVVFHVFNYPWCSSYLWIATISSEFIISYMKLEFFLLEHHLTFNCSNERRQVRRSRKKKHEWKSVGCCLLGAVWACVITVTVINFISQVQTHGGCFKNSSYAGTTSP